MGPYVFFNTALAGFFAFAVVHYAFQWWLARRETRFLVFSVHCLFCGLLSICRVSIAMATTLPAMDMALSGRTTVGLLITVTSVCLLTLLTGVRARAYVNFVIIVCLSLAAVNAFALPLNGTVTQIDRISLAWGEELSFPTRAPPGWWAGPIYAVILSVYGFGVFAAMRLWNRDRIAGVIVCLATLGGLLAVAVGILSDLMRANLPYAGGVSQVLSVGMIALMQSREYVQRGERLATGERRFRAIFDQTFQFIGLLNVDGTLLEANRTALAFAGIREEDVIGKPFWETPWWSHSPQLQEQLRHAVTAAGRGEFVRLEVTHPAADGMLHHVDFSLKPVRDEAGAVVLLIPEGRDVTVWKQSELALQKSEASLRAFINSIPEPAFLLDTQGAVLVGNDALARSLGRDIKDVIGKIVFQLLPAGVAESRKSQLDEMCRTGRPQVFEDASNGRHFMNHASPVIDAAGHVTRVAVLALDITERKRVEETLRESEARYRTLVEFAPEAILVLDMSQGTFVDVNENACRMFNLSRDELLRLGPLALSPPVQPDGRASPEKARHVLGQALAGEPMRVEWVCRDAAGRDIPCEISLVRLPSAERPLIRGSIIDISERKRAEDLLRRKDAELRQLFESDMIGIVFWDADEAFTEANEYFLNLVGYSRDELVAGRIRWVDLTAPDFRDVHEQSLADVVQRGSCAPIETEYVTKAGLHVPVLVGATRVDDQTDQGVAFVLDLTQTKRLEDQFRQAQKMEAVGQLAGGVAHDFNNLLTIIIGYAEAVFDRLPTADPMRGSANAIIEAGERAAALTRQLLAFSRQQVLQPKALNLNLVISKTETLLRRLIGEDVILTADLDPKLGIVRADPSQLEQVLMNLAVNARDAMPEGGALLIETRNVVLDETFCRALADVEAGPYSMLAVIDSGIGMDAATRARAFEPFFTTKGPGKGTGLGLATVHGIVKQSGGHVEVFSELSGGTTVKIYLPQIEAAPSVVEPKPATRELPRGSETVLLVEDEDAVRKLGQHILRSCGYAVLEARDGKQAIEIASGHVGKIDVLVSDVVMPHLGGNQLAERITALRPACKVLFLSGYTADAVLRHGVVESEFDFLQKPFTPMLLAQKVREVLDRDV